MERCSNTPLKPNLSIVPESVRIDWNSSRADLAKLHSQAQDLLLTILTVAAILNSRLRDPSATCSRKPSACAAVLFVPRPCWTCDGSSSAAKDSAKNSSRGWLFEQDGVHWASCNVDLRRLPGAAHIATPVVLSYFEEEKVRSISSRKHPAIRPRLLARNCEGGS